MSSGVIHVQQGSGAYAADLCCICARALLHMRHSPAAYAPEPCCIIWQYFFCVYFEHTPMKLIQSNAYGGSMMASVPLDSYGSGN